MLAVDISRTAAKFLKDVPAKHGAQIAAKIMGLRENPLPSDSVQLKGKASVYRRADSGEYRIIYYVEGGVLRIVLVGRRNDDAINRLLQRRL